MLSYTVAVQAGEPSNVASLAARTSPEWLTRGVIYQIWLRSFTPEGTLRAAAARLPDLADLGVTVVYLPPVQLQDDDTRREFWSTRQKQSAANNPRNPYRIKDFNRIDPEYGTEADLKQFIETAHQHGLKVLMDLVYHHTGPTCVLLEHPDYYLRDEAGKPLTNVWNFLRLNLENAELREYLFANMERWVKDYGVDGFRCDVAGAVPLSFWEEARTRLDPVRPDLVILAEDDKRPGDQVKAFDIDYSFRWYSRSQAVVARGESAATLRQLWEEYRSSFPRGARFIRYSDNHDLHRADVVFSENGARAVSVLNFTIDGVPYLYNGQEIGDATPQDLFSHWAIRWEAAGLPKAVAKREFYQKLCQLRRGEPALATGEVVWLDNSKPDSVVSFLRRTEKEEILAVVNLSNRPQEARISLPEKGAFVYRNLLTDGSAQATAEGFAMKLNAFEYFVGKRTRQ
jgi:glycosidase